MGADRWRRIREVLDALKDAPIELRDAALTAACRGDADLRLQVQQLLDDADRLAREELAGVDERRNGASRRQAERPLRNGDLVGRYRIVSVIDRGGNGLLYKATDASLHNRLVVLKEVGVESAADVRQRQFEREKEALARVRHPSVVDIYGFEEQDGRCFIVTPFLDGIPLPMRLPSRVRKPEVSLALAGAVQAVHDAGLIHNDIKPENVILTKDGRAVLIDLGIAEDLGGGMRTQTLRGTAPYLAPERLFGERPSPASDVYSFGLVLYGIWTGLRPYTGRDLAEMLEHKLTDVLPRQSLQASPAPPAAIDLIVRMTAWNPSERPTMAAVVEQLATVNGMPAPAPRGPRRMAFAASIALALTVPALSWHWADGVRRVSRTEPDARDAGVRPQNRVFVPPATKDARRDDATPPADAQSVLPGSRPANTTETTPRLALPELRSGAPGAAGGLTESMVIDAMPTPTVAIALPPAIDAATNPAVASGPPDDPKAGERVENPFAPVPSPIVPPSPLVSSLVLTPISFPQRPALDCEALRAGARNALNELQAGYRERNVKRIASVFPGLSATELQSIGVSFAEFKEYDYRWDIDGAVIELSPTCVDEPPTSARIRAQRTIHVRPRVGRSKTDRAYLTVQLERRGAQWAIVSINRS